MSALPTLPHNADQAYIDRVIASNNGKPGALLGILAVSRRSTRDHKQDEVWIGAAMKRITIEPVSRIECHAKMRD
jgi:hypothetical protein